MDHDPTVQQEYVGHDLALQLGALEHAPSTGTCYRFPATPRVRRKPQTLQATDSAKAQNHTPGKPQSPLSPLPLQGPWFPVIQRAQTPRHPRSGSIPQIIGHDPTPQLGYLGHDLAPQMGLLVMPLIPALCALPSADLPLIAAGRRELNNSRPSRHAPCSVSCLHRLSAP